MAVEWMRGQILNISREPTDTKICQIWTSTALISLIHIALNLLTAKVKESHPQSPHSLEQDTEEKAWLLMSVLCQERRHKAFGDRSRVFRHGTASTFELKDLPSSQRHYIAESSNTTPSQTQTSASSKLLDKSLELESHQCAYIQSTPHIPNTHHGRNLPGGG